MVSSFAVSWVVMLSNFDVSVSSLSYSSVGYSCFLSSFSTRPSLISSIMRMTSSVSPSSSVVVLSVRRLRVAFGMLLFRSTKRDERCPCTLPRETKGHYNGAVVGWVELPVCSWSTFTAQRVIRLANIPRKHRKHTCSG